MGAKRQIKKRENKTKKARKNETKKSNASTLDIPFVLSKSSAPLLLLILFFEMECNIYM